MRGADNATWKAWLPLAACALNLTAACSNLADGTEALVGIGTISLEKSTFNNATVITMGPAWLYGATSLTGAVPVKLGANWSSDNPDQVALLLKMDSNSGSYAGAYRSLQGIDVNVGGNTHTFRSSDRTSFDRTPYNTVSRTIYTTSTNAVTVPLALVREMVKADYCRVRIATDRGYEEADFTVERSQYGGAGARHYMRTFLERVDAARGEKSS